MTAFPRTILPIEVSELDIPGPLISKAQSGRVNIRSTQQIGRTWTERYLLKVSNTADRAFLGTVRNLWRNGTIFTIGHVDYAIPKGAGGGSPLVNSAAQLVTQPVNFGTWTAVNVTLLSGQTDPFGGTAAYKLTATAGGDNRLQLGVTYTGDDIKAVLIYAKADMATESHLKISGAAIRHQIKLTWTAGVPTLSTDAGSGTLFTPESKGSGWYAITFNANSIIAADSNLYSIYPAATAGTGSTYFYGANSWNTPYPLQFLATTGTPTQIGSSLVLDGAPASTANWLRTGDIVSIAGLPPIYEVTADVTTLAGGHALLPINPPVFTGGAPADNAAVTITGVTMNACIIAPPEFPTTSGRGADFGECVIQFSEVL